MANICTTNYTIGGGKAAVQSLSDTIEKLRAGKWIDLGIDSLLDELGINHEGMDTRAWITYSEKFGDTLTIDVDSKWAPCHEAFRAINKHYHDALDIKFMSEEFGNGYYTTNNEDDDSVYVSWRHNGVENSMYFDFRNDAFCAIEEVFGGTINNEMDVEALSDKLSKDEGNEDYLTVIYCEWDFFKFSEREDEYEG